MGKPHERGALPYLHWIGIHNRHTGIESVPGFSATADSTRLMPICLNLCHFQLALYW